MIWAPAPVRPDDLSAEDLFHMFDQHNLVPENVDLAIAQYRGMAESASMINLVGEDGDPVAHVIVSEVVDGEHGNVDLVIKSRFFSPYAKGGKPNTTPFLQLAKEALQPVFEGLMERRRLRRLTSLVPRERSRTVKVLRECGFKKEGVLRRAVKLKGKPVDDVIVMGMVSKE